MKDIVSMALEKDTIVYLKRIAETISAENKKSPMSWQDLVRLAVDKKFPLSVLRSQKTLNKGTK